MHVIDDLIGDALIVQLRQLRCCKTINGARIAHFLNDCLGRHTVRTHLDNFTYRDRRFGFIRSKVAQPANRLIQVRKASAGIFLRDNLPKLVII